MGTSFLTHWKGASKNIREGVCVSREQYQPDITCSKLIIETLEEGVKYIQS